MSQDQSIFNAHENGDGTRAFWTSPFALASAMLNLGHQLQQRLSDVGDPSDTASGDAFSLGDPVQMMTIAQDGIQSILKNPTRLAAKTTDYWMDSLRLWGDFMAVSLGQKETLSTDWGDRYDNRFKDARWHQDPPFNFMRQSYLLWDRWLSALVADLGDLDAKKAHKVRFYTRQLSSLLSPSNYVWSNPQVAHKTIASSGLNLLQGIENFYRDLERGKGQLAIKMVDETHFRLGETIAATPGKVVFRNTLIELIQYAPTTKSVYDIPLVIVPPCINKFYIFDLKPDYSFVRWCIDRGQTVFVISWVNPTEELAHKTFEDYVFEGIDEAIAAARGITQAPRVNCIGFCIGGNLLSFLSTYYGDRPDNPIGSTTYLATLFDFEKSGDLGVFIDEKQLALLEERTIKKGYMDGQLLARTFNLLRANDLIWSFVINNYLLGEEPGAFDLLYWNADSTNLPTTMFLYYLRELFLHNKLIQKGALTIRGVPVDLARAQVPSFILSTKDDHIAPWQSGFKGAHLLGGEATFVLGGSGHIAGVFNHPKMQKYAYWTGPVMDRAEDWFKNAQSHPGSWWDAWGAWVEKRSGSFVAKRTPGTFQFPALDPAPGRYVLKA